MARSRVIRQHDRRSSDERRKWAEARLTAQRYPGGTSDAPRQVFLVLPPSDEHGQPALYAEFLDDGRVTLRGVDPRGGARPRVHEEEVLDAVPLQELLCSLLVHFVRDEHHLRL